jgi:hypothetical protein
VHNLAQISLAVLGFHRGDKLSVATFRNAWITWVLIRPRPVRTPTGPGRTSRQNVRIQELLIVHSFHPAQTNGPASIVEAGHEFSESGGRSRPFGISCTPTPKLPVEGSSLTRGTLARFGYDIFIGTEDNVLQHYEPGLFVYRLLVYTISVWPAI